MDWRRHIARYGDGWFPGEPWVRWTFLGLFALATVLRFWNLPDLPFTHDELSALMRIYPTLSETIQRGVVELDTHPPGVQVFEWAWTKLFGTSEAVVKLPFILLALVALFFLYRSALSWTAPGTALISIALLATLQYTVLYAQIARPYAMGFFTIALLGDQITRYVAFNKRANLIGIGVASVLSAYTHHFSLLLAGIMVVSSFPLLHSAQRKPFLLMCGIGGLAYAPNLFIFAKQLALGGLGNWLPPPDGAWLPEYLCWIMHFSWPLAILIGSSLVIAMILSIKRRALPTPAKWILPLWGLSPLVIGFAYSVWRAPVLQYSLILFSFPFVLFWAFSGYRDAPKWLTTTMTALLAVVATGTLIVQRKHYVVFSDSPYSAMVRVAADEVEQYGSERTLVIFDAPRPQVTFHVRRHGLDRSVEILWARQDVDKVELRRILADPKWERVVLGTTNGCLEERIAHVRSEFPNLIHLEDHVEGQVHVFSRDTGASLIVDRSKILEFSPSRGSDQVKVDPSISMWHDSISHMTAWEMDGHEFGISASLFPKKESYHAEDLFEGELLVSNLTDNSDIALVFELRDAADEMRLYRSERAMSTGRRSKAIVALSTSWAQASPEPLRFHIYAYNPSKGPVRVHGLDVYHRDRNPVRNGLLKPVERLGHLPLK